MCRISAQVVYFYKMPINKNALIRYIAIDRCLANTGRNYDINDLLYSVNKSLFEYNPKSEGIKKRQLYEDIRFMESSQGYSIELDKFRVGKKVYYRYNDSNFSINNLPINELEAEQIKSAMEVLARFKGMPQFKWVNELLPKLDQTFLLKDRNYEIMSFESNPFLKGLEFWDPLFNAILNQRTLEITYRPYDKEAFTATFFPYHLKQFNSRWFLFGRNPDYQSLTNYALDRIVNVKELDLPYVSTAVNFDEYFEDVIGVTLNELNSEIIEIKVSKYLWNYIETKPLHGSQKKKSEDKDNIVFVLDVIPNFELEKLVLSFGEEMEVLSPVHFREKIRLRIEKSIRQYE